MKKTFILLIPLFFGAATFIFTLTLFSGVSAQTEDQFASVVFPVKELGGCRNFKECTQFCDSSQNAEACTDFALKNGLISPEKARIAKKMLASATSGPGGCRSEKQCKTYCDDITHIDECLDFAEKEEFMPPDELKEARAVAKALKQGARLPGNCTSKDKCEVYCEDSTHTEECVAFAEAAGFISPEEATMVRKTGGVGPGNCRGKEKCDAYCSNPDNMEVCINFAVENNLMPPDELEEAKMVLGAVKKGIKPPNCRSKADCDKYCSEPDHAEECVAFAEAAGFMSPEEAEQVKKMMKLGILSGPGGCKGKEQCETYCDDPNNMEECVDFGVKAGFIPPEEAENARKMARLGLTSGPGGCKGQDECETYCEDPEHGDECVEFAVKAGFMEPEEAEMAKKMMSGGPGGCKGEECKTYCDDPSHQEECFIFAKENNLIPQDQLEEIEKSMQMMQQGGPGGCKTKEECEAYCAEPEHGEECMNWAIEQGMMPAGEERGTREMMRGPTPSRMERGSGGGSATRVSIQKDSSTGLHNLMIIDTDGVQEFSFNPTEGPGYGGGIAGCPREYRTQTGFFGTAGFPINAVITDCQGNAAEINIAGEGTFSSDQAGGASPSVSVPGREEFRSPEGFGESREMTQPGSMMRPPTEEEIGDMVRQQTEQQIQKQMQQQIQEQTQQQMQGTMPQIPPVESVPSITPQEVPVIPAETAPSSLRTTPSLLGNALGAFQRLLLGE